jgi:hypothetical protein
MSRTMRTLHITEVWRRTGMRERALIIPGGHQGSWVNLGCAALGVWGWESLRTRAVSALGSRRYSRIWIGVHAKKLQPTFRSLPLSERDRSVIGAW